MKILVTGVKGQLGYDVVHECEKRGHHVRGVDVEEMDITDMAAVSRVMKETCPDVVVHCAAWTAVDAAEDEDNISKVRAINAGGTQNIATVCKELGCKLIYISTDYVFDGQGTKPWEPECIRADQARRGAGCCEYVGKILHRAHSVGVRRQREEFHQDDAECR